MTSQQYALTTRSQRQPSASTSNRTARLVVPPFLQKVYEMLNDPANANLIRWSEAGDSFYVLDHERFARELLGRWFKHQNFNTFVRQLNMYGFHKIPHLHQGALRSEPDTDFWHYEHPNFIRGQPELLGLIQRKKQANTSAEETALDIRNPSTSGTNSLANATNLSPGQILDIHTIINGVAAIKRHQQTIASEMSELKKSNQLLWQDAISSRARYQKHQDTINKILRFLGSVFGHGAGSPVRNDENSHQRSASPIHRRPARLLLGNGPMEDGVSSSSSKGKVQVTEVEDEDTPNTPIHRVSDDYTVETPKGTDSTTPQSEPVFSPQETVSSHPSSSTTRSLSTEPALPSISSTEPQSSYGADPNDNVLQSALAQLLSQPGQMQRLLAAFANQPMSIPNSDNSSTSQSQLTQFDPSLDFSHMFSPDVQHNNLPYLSPAQPNHSTLPPLPPMPSPPLNGAQLTEEDTNKTMDTVESSLNSLIQSLGVGDFNAPNLTPMDGEDGGDRAQTPHSPSSGMVNNFDEGKIDATNPEFDFEALLNDLAASDNPLGGGFGDMPSTAFLDEASTPSAISPSTPTVPLPETIEPVPDLNTRRKRKSGAMDLDGAAAVDSQTNGKTKTRRTG